MWRAIASNALSLLIVALVILAGAIAWGKGQYTAEGPLSSAICLRVASGSTMTKVSKQLEEQGAVSSGSIFRIGADYTDKVSQLKAGAFLVPEKASMEEIVDIVTRGGASSCGTEVVYRIGVNRTDVLVRELDPATQSYVRVAEFFPDVTGNEPTDVPEKYTEVRGAADTRFRISVAEGTTVWRVLESLKGVDFLTGSIDTDEVPAEGTLAPDSYEVQVASDVDDLIARMVEAQENRIAEIWENRVDDLPISSPQEALILASIIEKETGIPTERRQVASVFVNRLNQGMRLQTDPTVVYGVSNGNGVLGRGLRQSELQSDSPYNTYRIPALPPGPIANPGLASLQAAVNPDDTPYIFFVADGTGGHAFAVTLADHNANVAKWREIESAN
ncbi:MULTISPECIES: endolytic transglycosylase MltG [Pacificibacter]|uniref:endolytic transglycosylase MltG n=1 Tax=Pacificibacter TaxID=1042323 RepID=UPI001C08ADA3|nr:MULTISPECIES: endolytic transglycosylase MltG [Pacificibacter]MBU2935646.1 endolytic transglycosylase MltG [Pacificibacter marinus]MDO6614142.1 endolytic transglycosylase MltG [Pacificibacter sp. 1_MG-2023]